MSAAPIGQTTDKKPKFLTGKTSTYLGVGGALLVFLVYRRMSATKAVTASGIASTLASSPTNNTASDPSGLTSMDIGTIEGQLSGFAQDLAGVQSSVASQLANQDATQATSLATQNGVLAGIVSQLNAVGAKVASVGQQASTATGNEDSVAGLSAAMANTLIANGEHIVDTVKSSTGGWLYLTNKGGVYNTGGSQAFGSYLGYAASTSNPGAEIAGHGDFNAGHLIPLANGHYTEVNSKGETYTF